MYLCCLLPCLIYFPTFMARYSLFVLKVPLNPKQTNKNKQTRRPLSMSSSHSSTFVVNISFQTSTYLLLRLWNNNSNNNNNIHNADKTGCWQERCELHLSMRCNSTEDEFCTPCLQRTQDSRFVWSAWRLLQWRPDSHPYRNPSVVRRQKRNVGKTRWRRTGVWK